MLPDDLEDTLMPPLDTIVAGMRSAIPSVVKSAKTQLDKFFASLPFSAILHLVLIETMTIWIFLYSVVNVLTSLVKEGSIERNQGAAMELLDPEDRLVPPAERMNPCLDEYARRIVWPHTGEMMSDWDCYDKDLVDGPYEPEEDDTGVAWVMSLFSYGCVLLCVLLWLVVVGNFLWHTSCRFWVRYQSGEYLKASYMTRRNPLYRLVCGLLGTCAVLAIGVMALMTAKLGVIEWFLSSQLTNLFVVLTSARSFLAPTKPKFEYSELHQLNFKRSTFFQTNGAFAVKLSDALIQSARGSQFRGPLVNLLANKKDWEKALRICFVGKNKSGAPNKQLLKLWGVAKENIPAAFSAAQDNLDKL